MKDDKSIWIELSDLDKLSDTEAESIAGGARNPGHFTGTIPTELGTLSDTIYVNFPIEKTKH